ncbi:MAG: malonyl-CoA-ACP transacylase [Clostridiales bacterium]|nr:MAG: malonyl-CoA-ACP transacylase [Clostridiales bacterium]
MKIAFIYGGQGAQVVGMGKDYYHNDINAKQFYDNLHLDTDVKKYAFEASLTEITQTDITQIVIVAYQVMVTDLLRRKGIVPDVTLGLSIGEYSALYAAGILSRQDTLKSAEMRGRYMAEIDADTEMYAILRADESDIKAALEQANDGRTSCAYIANYNCPGQIVISGDRTACQKAAEILSKAKKKAIKLNVSSAFHTPFMEKAAVKFAKFLEQVSFQKPNIPLFSNLTGQDQEIDASIMVDQMRRPVRLETAIRNMLNSKVDKIIEIGYNNTIKNFIKRIDRKVKVNTISDFDSFTQVIGESNVC